MSLRRLFAIACLFVFSAPLLAAQVNLYVTNSSDTGYGTLRRAITNGNALASNDVPNIHINLPEYDPIRLNSPLPVITKNVAIIHGVGSLRSVIDGRDEHSIFRIKPPSGSGYGLVQIYHLTLHNGRAIAGGCLSSELDGGLLIISDMRFRECSAMSQNSLSPSGGAIYTDGSEVSISDSEFFNNQANGINATGGAVYMNGHHEDSLSIDNSTFQGNQTIGAETLFSRGGAIYTFGASLRLTESIFRDNGASQPASSDPGAPLPQGGAISCRYCRGTVSKNSFTMNQAGEGGAMYITNSASGELSMDNNNFVANTADTVGGALHVLQSQISVRNNSFFLNTAPTGSVLSVDESVFWFLNSLIAGTAADNWCTASGASTAVGGAHTLRPPSACIDSSFSVSEKIRSEVRVQGYLLDTTYPITRRPVRPFVHSEAVDGGNAGAPDDDVVMRCAESDLLGKPRPVDGLVNGSARCDIGAFEWQHEASLFADDFEYRLQPTQ